jgi:cell fate (sporulation/competence/biofilm development) regulator YmcA (YheA/YmcA/DUF963 family)
MKSKRLYSNSEILEQTRQLGMALAESAALELYKKAEERMANDPEACRLTGAFKRAQRELVRLSQENNGDTDAEALEEAKAAVVRADREMKAYPIIHEYYKAGEALNNLIRQINGILKFYCLNQGELPGVMEKSGGCNGCEGCGKGC